MSLEDSFKRPVSKSSDDIKSFWRKVFFHFRPPHVVASRMRWGPALASSSRLSRNPPRAGPRTRVARTTTTTTTGLCRGRRATRPIVVSDDRTMNRLGTAQCDGETTARTYSRGLQSRTGDGRFGGRFAIPRARSGASRELLRVFVWGMPVLLKGLTGVAAANNGFSERYVFGG